MTSRPRAHQVKCDVGVFERRWLIAAWKFLSGVLDFGVGFALLTFSERRLDIWADRLITTELQEDPGDRLALFLDRWLPALIDRKTSVALVLLAWGAASMVAAVGFLRRRPWGYYAILILISAFMFFDVPHFIRKPTLAAALFVIVNVVVMFVLVKYRRSFLEC